MIIQLRPIYVLCILVVQVMLTPGSAAAGSIAYPGGMFTVQIVAEHATSSLAQPTRIDCRIQNNTDREIRVLYEPLSFLCPLTVIERTVGVVRQNILIGARPDNRYAITFAPKQRVDFGFAKLSAFGFDLSRPGHYTITASFEGIATFTAMPTDRFYIDGSDKSTPIDIMITSK